MKGRIGLILGLVVLPGLLFAMPGPGRGGPWNGHPGMPPGGGHGLMFPPKDPTCVFGCREDMGGCLMEVRDASAPCLTECGALRDAAREACEADPSSPACREARHDAHQCERDCRTQFGPAVVSCLESARTCIDGCPVIDDPECLSDCQGTRRECVSGVRDDTQICRDGCAEEMNAARDACRGEPKSEACQTARTEARECLEPCVGVVRDGLDACAADFRTCASACVTPTPPPNGE